MRKSIPNSLNPTYLEYLKAKSKDKGGDTLAEHTWAVLSRLADQYRLRPHLSEQWNAPRLWHQLYWACFLHDFGKAAQQFQERLFPDAPKNLWSEGRHRHEVLSLAFLNGIFPKGHPDRLLIVGTIGSHHKDIVGDEHGIKRKYGGISRNEDQQKRVEFLAEQIQPRVVNDLWQWLMEYGILWAEYLKIPIEPVNIQPYYSKSSIYEAMNEWTEFFDDIELFGVAPHTRHLASLMRGVILTSDHSASAGVGAFPIVVFKEAIYIRSLKERTLNDHQRAMQTTQSRNTLLIAPTGSGKTEAALLWAKRQAEYQPYARLFYTLPYQASMNAMQNRLQNDLFEANSDLITIQHSRATLKLYQDAMEADSGTEDDKKRWNAYQHAQEQKNRTRLNYYPVQVFSPYQMLKVAYQLKGYEALLLDYTGAVFIFDEIHAYDANRMAMIVSFMAWLRQHFGARFLVMTATLPPTARQVLKEALDLSDADEVTASQETFQESQRHTVRLLDGELLHYIEDIVAYAESGKRVLVVANQVKRAQAFYEALKARYNGDSMLLHGRFMAKDRSKKEAFLSERAGVSIKHDGKPLIVVATQVVEVSLNVDFDTLYSDPAPLEALLQRFGRVNRGREKNAPLCDVHIMRQPDDEKTLLPYEVDMVARSLQALESLDGLPIDEAKVTALLEEVYDATIRENWHKKYDNSANTFKGILEQMKPYQSADKILMLKFYENFDGRQVIPLDYHEEYLIAIEEKRFFDAMAYFVNMTQGQYHMLKGKKLIREEDDFVSVALVAYDEENGLQLDKPLQGEREMAFEDEDV